jgi:putative aldouronate transport system substrate-binding protein
MNRTLRLIVGLVLLAPLALFASGQPDKAGAAGGIQVSPPGQFPIVAAPVTLRVFAIQDPRVENLDTNDYTLYMEKKTGVHIKWELVPQSGVDEKRRLILASGDYPDVFYGVNLTRDELLTYGGQGALIRLNDLIDKHGFEVLRCFKEYPSLKSFITAPDGGIYSLFYINECYHCSMSMKMWIQRFWLKDLGLKMPETTDDFARALRAFKDRDPNKNGKKDEIPLSGAVKNSWWGDPYNFLLNAFIYNDGGQRLLLKSGVVDFAANKGEWRDGLRYIRGLYAEGLIDPAAFTQDQAAEVKLGENPDVCILGATGAGYPGNFTQRSAASLREGMYDAVPALKGPAGVRNSAYFPQDPGLGRFAISKTCKYPEVAFKWNDLRLNLEESINFNYGLRGVYWEWASPGEVGLDGKPATWRWIKDPPIPSNVKWNMWGDFYYPTSWRVGQSIDKNWDMYDPKQLNARLHVETANKMEPAKPAEYYPSVWMTKDVSSELAQLGTQIQTYVTESTVRFVVGDLNLDAAWDSYVAELDKMGLRRYIELYQKGYDAQYKKK